MQQATLEKLEKIQSLLDAGLSHPEIAKELGYTKMDSYYHYINKYDDYLQYKKLYRKKNYTVVQSENEVENNESIEKKVSLNTSSSKAEAIIMLIERRMDMKEVAKKKGYKDIQEMANYMKSQGYIWNSDKKNYIQENIQNQTQQETNSALMNKDFNKNKEPINIEKIRDIMNKDNECSCECIERYKNILAVLEEKQDKLYELLYEESYGTLKKYRIRGETKTKSINFINTLDRLIANFCDEMNITQKEAFETAIIDFLKKYGYKDEVNNILVT